MEIRDSGVPQGVYAGQSQTHAPLPEERLAFLRTLQRVLKEGDFTATYKFALLQALMDLSVESRIVDASRLWIGYRDLAARFVEYYWNHSRPYRPGQGVDGVLAQSTGRQAAVIAHIASAREATSARTLTQLRRGDGYEALLGRVARIIRDQPVRYIQNLNGGRVEFLFDVEKSGIRLKRSVAWCLQEFYDLIQGQVRAGWVAQVKAIRRNADLIGDHKDLESFLFGQDRLALGRVRERLFDLDGSRCFYCDRHAAGEMEVDHFVPWSRYPRDLGHNFVLAHRKCNGSKRDALAATEHYVHWSERLEARADHIKDALQDLLACDAESSRKVTLWAYRQEIDSSGMFWLRAGSRSAEYAEADDSLRRIIGTS